ncbi:DUF6732 family protein [Hoeflea olei]|uniref:Uncharacterized protein n=1 Tax=Hoeflea olei TaxID=1480615 RepID=A0A1C1YVQ5_9HYPH|nr:DUF6732 family protein [Hoeflea olei]OCW57613.1 hypothetical protein AWJ14_01995 [Hoeflea olei]
MRTLVLSLLVLGPGASDALAHGGHLGDLAGHSHWLGWAAAAAAGAVAAWAIRRKTRAADADHETQPESAEA